MFGGAYCVRLLHGELPALTRSPISTVVPTGTEYQEPWVGLDANCGARNSLADVLKVLWRFWGQRIDTL